MVISFLALSNIILAQFQFLRHTEPRTETLQCRLVSGSENQMLKQVHHDEPTKLSHYPNM